MYKRALWLKKKMHGHTNVAVVENIKRRGREPASSCFRAIKHFHFQFLVGVERRTTVGGRPVADDRWFVYRRSLCSSSDIIFFALSFYASLFLSPDLPPSSSPNPLVHPFGLFVASIFFFLSFFFRGFPFRAASLQPRPIDNPAIRITLENRTDTKQLFNAAYCGFGLSRLKYARISASVSARTPLAPAGSFIIDYILLSLYRENDPSARGINIRWRYNVLSCACNCTQ